MIKTDKDELSIYEVESLHKDLLTELQNGNIIVDMSATNKVDMSVIQLFISSKRSCMEDSKTFELTNVNEELSKIFQNSGCESLLGVSND